MFNNFDRCLKLVLKSEGGNDDDPDDPGGRTSRGITQREYNKFRDKQDMPHFDVWKATDDEVAEIYHDNYWLPLCDGFPAGVDYLYFDMNVNNGPKQAAKLLQRGLGVEDDGAIGSVTLEAIKKAEPSRLIKKTSEARKSFYRSLKTFWKYGKGWLRRVESVQTDALLMTKGE